MTQSYTTTSTWSRTNARIVAGKVAADLRQLTQEYGRPTDAEIDDYLGELTILMTDKYIESVTYGYRKDGAWLVALKYTADMSGNLIVDDRSGRIPRGTDVTGAVFYSYLEHNSKWHALTQRERDAIEAILPVKRSAGIAPGIKIGTCVDDKTYTSAGCGLRRTAIGGVA